MDDRDDARTSRQASNNEAKRRRRTLLGTGRAWAAPGLEASQQDVLQLVRLHGRKRVAVTLGAAMDQAREQSPEARGASREHHIEIRSRGVVDGLFEVGDDGELSRRKEVGIAQGARLGDWRAYSSWRP